MTNSPGPKIWQCFAGGLVSGGLSLLLLQLTFAIAHRFAHQPLSTHNMTVVRITIALRTLVVGTSALGLTVFGLVSLGLFGLGVQLLGQRWGLFPKANPD